MHVMSESETATMVCTDVVYRNSDSHAGLAGVQLVITTQCVYPGRCLLVVTIAVSYVAVAMRSRHLPLGVACGMY